MMSTFFCTETTHFSTKKTRKYTSYFLVFLTRNQ